MELIPSNLADYTLESYIIRISSRSRMIYWTVIILVVGGIAILPFVYVDVSVQTRGYFQSEIEKQKIYTPFQGKILLTRIKNGIKVEKGDTLLIIDSETIKAQKTAILKKILENESSVSDLKKLNLIENPDIPLATSSFRTDRYFIEYSHMLKSRAIQFQKYRRSKTEHARNEILHSKELIPDSDFENSQFSLRSEEENLNQILIYHKSIWQADLMQRKNNASSLQAELEHCDEELNNRVLLAPVSGEIIQSADIQSGAVVGLNQVLAEISPEGELVATCFVNPGDIGLINTSQDVRIMVDAFHYNEWGMLNASISEISDDMIVDSESNVYFRIRCRPEKTFLSLKNGVRADLKKGMSLNARIVVTRRSLFILKTGQRIDASLILGYYQHLLKLPQSFFDNMRTGEIISRIGDAVKIRVFINDVSINLVLNIFILIVSFILMFTFFWKLALVMLVVVPFYFAIYRIYDRLNKKVQRKVMERGADLEAQLVESLNSAATIKRFSLEDYSNFKTETRFVALLETIYKSGLNSIFSSTASSFITQLIILILLWTGTGFVLKTEITPGELLSFYAVVGYFTGPVTSIIGFNRSLQDAKIAADRLFEIFDLEIDDDSGKVEFKPEMISDISFENVKFRYGTRIDVFDSLNLKISKGEITAIVGESGSGKTTLVSLLQNIYPLQSGHIRIGQYDILHFSGRSLRKLVSVVPQRIDLFAGSLMENIAIGELDPDMDRILQVCEKPGMTKFVESLPNGLQTYIGENGANLSGGQKQRIAIARALYRDPEILVLDEATSSLDSIAETFVRDTIKLMKEVNKTVIVIAHRLSTINLADRIIVLDKGIVVQEGTFAELSNAEGHFRQMWTHQSIESKELFKV